MTSFLESEMLREAVRTVADFRQQAQQTYYMTFGHNPLSWTPMNHLMFRSSPNPSGFTEVTSDYAGDYYIVKPTGGGTFTTVYEKDGTTRIGSGNWGSGSMTREEKIESALKGVKHLIGNEANYVVEGTISDYHSGHDDYKKDGLDPDTNGDTNGDANGDANGDTNGDLDPEPCDDANRETNADGSCASSCKTGYDFESSSADAKCVLVEVEKGMNWPLLIGGITVLGVGAYFTMNR